MEGTCRWINVSTLFYLCWFSNHTVIVDNHNELCLYLRILSPIVPKQTACGTGYCTLIV